MRRNCHFATIVVLTATVLFSSCELLETLLGGKDSEAPTVTIISPAAGSEVSGLVIITAEASDDTGVFKVVFKIDNQIVCDDRSQPWTYAWDSGLASAESHILVAEAWDQAGNYRASDPVLVTVIGGQVGAWDEDFAGYPLGATGSLEPGMPADASWVGMTLGDGSLDIVNDPTGGGKSPTLRLAQTTDTGDLALLFAQVPGAAKGRASLSIYVEDGGALQISLGSGDLDTSRSAIFLWLVEKDGVVQPAWFASASTVQYGGTGKAISAGVWHELGIVFDCGEALWALLLDGNLLAGGLPMSSTFLGAPFAELEFLSLQTTPPDPVYAGGAYLVDDLVFESDASVTVPPGDGGTATITGPSSLAATPGEGEISLTWTDSSSDEEGFLVLRSADEGFADYNILADLASGTTSWTDTAAEEGAPCYYLVVAYRAEGAGTIFGYSPIAYAEALPGLGLAAGVYVAGSIGSKAVIWHDDGTTTQVIELTDGSTVAAAEDLCVEGDLIWATGYRTNSSDDTEAMRWSLNAEGTVGTTLLKASQGYGSAGKAITASGGQVYVAGEDWDVDPGICATLWAGTTTIHLSDPDAFSVGNAICVMDFVGPVVAGNMNDQFGLVYGTSGMIYAMDWLDDGSPGKLSGTSVDGRGYGITSYNLDLYIAGSLRDGSYNRATYWIDDFSTMTPYKFGPFYVASEATAIVVESGTVWCAGSYQVEGDYYRAALWSGTGASLEVTDLPAPLASSRASGEDLARESGVSWVSGTWKNNLGTDIPCYWTVLGSSKGRRDLGSGDVTVTVGGIAVVDPTPDYSVPTEPEPPELPDIYPSGVTASGLVAFYHFTGGTTDASGSGNNGTAYGSPTAMDDRFGNPDAALAFDGVNDYVSAADSPTLDLGAEWTISLWFNLGSLEPGDDYRLLYKSYYDDSPVSFDGGYAISVRNYYGTKQILFFDNVYGHSSIYTSSSTLSAGTWHHLCVEFHESAGKLWVYLDSILLAESSVLFSSLVSNARPLFLGRGNYAIADQDFLCGTLDDIRIFNRTLASTEIPALYAEGGWGQ